MDKKFFYLCDVNGYTVSMNLVYEQFEFSLTFFEPAIFTTTPVFLLRSVLGMHLHQMTCLTDKENSCSSCNFRKTCVYSTLFESIIEKDNETLPGRINTSHPYVISLNQSINRNSPVTELSFTLTLIGKFIDYLPYIFTAFKKAGISGLGNNRNKFKISDLKANGISIINKDDLHLPVSPKTWNLSLNDKPSQLEVFVEFITPFRYKKNGSLVNHPLPQDFFNCLFRRMKTLCLFYGVFDDFQYAFNENNIKIKRANIYWQDYERFSARQGQPMKLGGFMGNLVFEGLFSDVELSLLQGIKLFGGGKNTNFGLGQIDYWFRNKGEN